jgi:hypothetical protein
MNKYALELYWQGKTQVLGEKRVAVSLFPAQILHKPLSNLTWGFAVKRSATNHLNNDPIFDLWHTSILKVRKCCEKQKQKLSERSSVCRLDLGFRVCHSAVRLLTKPYYNGEGRPEDGHKTKGVSAEERNRKYEAVRLQVLFFLKENISFLQGDGSCLYVEHTESKHEIP